MLSSASDEENEAPEMWVGNGAYNLSCRDRDRDVVLSRRGWLTDKIICAAQMLLLQFFPNMAGLQPPTPAEGVCGLYLELKLIYIIKIAFIYLYKKLLILIYNILRS